MMKVLVACKRGNIAERDKWGHCLCQDCKAYRYAIQKEHRPKEYQLNWQKANKGKVKKYTKKWISENQERRKSIVYSWRKRNPDKVKTMSNKAGKKWAANNKALRNAITAKRRATLLNQTPQWADLEKIKQFYIEAARLTKETGIRHEVDHIFPLQGKNVNGLHVHYNLQILTRSKNRSKQNKTGDLLCVCS
jgi:hypothetical protein